MSFSSYNPNDRYRQRSARRTSGILTFMFVFFSIFGAGYWVGGVRSQQRIYILQEEKRILGEESTNGQNAMIELRAEAQTASVRLEQIRASYDELLSDGAMRDLVTLVRKQIDQGVGAERLESVILSARPPQNCSDPENKRFVVITPVYNGPSSKAFIRGGISVFGKGVSSKNSKGKKEAWFDPSQPVEVTFQVKGQTPTTKKGVLPIHNSMVVGNKEYRFTVTAGAKSFVKVTFDHCDYP
ncbi:MAG: hypothetical protein COB36_05555 [Alphaproteobacteria bacterium]|nr:MAG: hypothetical protein COB36_05555 [Alphaproteobacteria bacterium]